MALQLSEVVAALVEDLRAKRDRGAVLCDFDGTLSPIVDDPFGAKPIAGAAQVLRQLSEMFAVVAVVSGRPASFLIDRLSEAGNLVQLVGLYGLQPVKDGKVVKAHDTASWEKAVEQIARAAREEAPPGVAVEDKGISVTIHFRRAPGEAGWAHDFAVQWSKRTGMGIQSGRLAVELWPPISVDKGAVVERLAGDASAACFLGDDAGDIVAFDALDHLSERGTSVLRVAVADEESPDQLIERADLVVNGPTEALELLRMLSVSPG